MAIQFLNNLDLNLNEIQNAKLQILATDPSTGLVEGRIIYNSAENALKFYDGSAWIGLDGSGDIAGVLAGSGMSGGGTSGTITLTNADKGSTQNIYKNIVGDSGTATANSNNDSLTIAGGTNVTTSVSGDTLTITSTDTNTQLSVEAVEDIIGAMVAGNTETNIAVTYDDGSGKLNFVSTDTNTQLTDGQIAAFGYIKTDTNTQLSSEQVEDVVGGMLDGTETFITVGYDDANGNLDFVVPVKDEDNMASNSATHLATQQSIKAYVDTEINSVIDAAPGALDTLNELAAALGDDANHTTTMTNLIAAKTDKTSRQSLADSGDALTISGHAITLSRGDGSTDVVNVPTPTADIDSRTATHIISGDASTTSFAFNHGMSAAAVSVEVLDYGNNGSGASYETIYTDVSRTSTQVTVAFSTAPTATQDYLVLMHRITA